jgi:hypothetical protein
MYIDKTKRAAEQVLSLLQKRKISSGLERQSIPINGLNNNYRH